MKFLSIKENRSDILYALFVGSLLIISRLIFFPETTIALLGDDIYYHLITTREIIQTHQPFLLNDGWLFPPIGRPHLYPPLLHWLIAGISLVASLSLEKVVLVMQLFSQPLIIASYFFAAKALSDRKSAKILVLLSICYLPLLLRSCLCLPENLEQFLRPWLYVCWGAGKVLPFGLLLLSLLLTHTWTPLLDMVGILMGVLIFERKLLRKFAFSIVIALPGLFMHLYFLFASRGLTFYLADTLRPALSTISKFYFKPMVILGDLWPVLLLSVLGIIASKERKKNLWIGCWWVASLAILFSYSDRYYSYAAFPLLYFISFLVTSAEVTTFKKRLTITAIAAALFVIALRLPSMIKLDFLQSSAKFGRSLDPVIQRIIETEKIGTIWGAEDLSIACRLKYYLDADVFLSPKQREANHILSHSPRLSYPDYDLVYASGRFRVLKK